ncbi:type II toxin-antitoxin system VapC family toxin [Mycobacterium simiae]|uniref:type II toxin-antitoxin system VapC family toxin n=1 Tax=Mycobacterium simiae TaxID=1784 RepID=UPI00165EECED|nr:PIN domain-containing protein [Mycobacterium simiae]
MIVVLDASVLIAFFNGHDTHHPEANRLLAEAAGDDLVVSSLTLAELLVGPARGDEVDSTVEALARLEIDEERFPDDVAVQLARLRAETGLKTPHCCVLLAAQTAGAESVGTFDGRLAHEAKTKGLKVVGFQP